MDAELERLIALRHDLHAHPELAFEEHRSSDVVAAFLQSLGIEVHRGLAGTGVVGTLRNGDSTRSIGLRADMDALPVHEQNLFPHRSATKAACTPAATTATPPCCWARPRCWPAAATSTALWCSSSSRRGDRRRRRVMIEQGLFERFPVDAVFGMHNWPGLPAGSSRCTAAR